MITAGLIILIIFAVVYFLMAGTLWVSKGERSIFSIGAEADEPSPMEALIAVEKWAQRCVDNGIAIDARDVLRAIRIARSPNVPRDKS